MTDYDTLRAKSAAIAELAKKSTSGPWLLGDGYLVDAGRYMADTIAALQAALDEAEDEIKRLNRESNGRLATVSAKALEAAAEWQRAENAEAREKRLREALLWYAIEAEALSRYTLAKNVAAITASVQVLALDAGGRALAATEPEKQP